MTAKILVVDDSITIQKIVAMAFENEDASVEGMGNGSEALARLQNFHPDIVLADVDMPGLNGFELSQEIKNSRELRSISVLLLASDFEEFDENLFRASLADDHITKPFKSEDLIQKVTELLDGVATSAPDEATEEVIELSSTDRVDEDIIIDLGEDQLLDSPLEGFSSEGDEMDLALPEHHELSGLDIEPDEAASDVEEENVLSDPAEAEITDQDESLDELLMRVDKLSKKSEEISGNGSQGELSRTEAIDQMLQEVDALKSGSLSVDAKDEIEVKNNFEETTESRLSTDTTGNEAGIAEVDYISEENAEALAAAFNEITNGNKYPAHAIGIETSEHQESIYPEDALVTKDNEDIMEKNGDLPLSLEGQLDPLIETEVRRILKQSLNSLIEKELSGLSEKIMRTVEENVREITPGIAKAIIEKEIDKIKSMEDG